MSNFKEAIEHMQQTVQDVNAQSCQPCGCDAGAAYVCLQHREEAVIWAKNLVPDIKAWTPATIDGAPPRTTALPTAATERKQHPVASGVLDYFPKALAAVAHVSYVGNEQHNSGQPLHWDRSKSSDEADALIRHFLERGTLDKDGLRHSAKVAWRALALLEKELEQS